MAEENKPNIEEVETKILSVQERAHDLTKMFLKCITDFEKVLASATKNRRAWHEVESSQMWFGPNGGIH